MTFRSPKELRDSALFLAKIEGRDQSDEYREIFKTGVAEKRLQLALDKYARSEISLGNASELAGVTLWRFLELLQEKRIDLNLSADDVIQAAGEI